MNSRPLENRDIVNIDITVFLNGYHGDTSQTFLVGDVVRLFVSHFTKTITYFSLRRMTKVKNLSKQLVKHFKSEFKHAVLAARSRVSGKQFTTLSKTVRSRYHHSLPAMGLALSSTDRHGSFIIVCLRMLLLLHYLNCNCAS
jgi:methionine aminopeptidase